VSVSVGSQIAANQLVSALGVSSLPRRVDQADYSSKAGQSLQTQSTWTKNHLQGIVKLQSPSSLSSCRAGDCSENYP
jgi:hypothetical protein